MKKIRIITASELMKLKPVPLTQWKIVRNGIDTKKNNYFISKDRLWETNGEWGWERHMANKNWVDMREFVKVLTQAREKFIKMKPKKASIT